MIMKSSLRCAKAEGPYICDIRTDDIIDVTVRINNTGTVEFAVSNRRNESSATLGANQLLEALHGIELKPYP